MNRAFHKTPQGTEYEDIRAQEIIPILNESDILLIAMLSPRNSTSGRSKRQLFSLYDLHHDF